MIERGKLHPDQLAHEVLPALKNQKLFSGWDESGNPILVDPKRRPTVRHLVTHSSGLAYDFISSDMAKYAEVTGLPSIGTLKKAAIYEQPLFFEPASRWEYGTGIDALGLIVEEVTGQTLGEFMKENIFDPLGMKDTSFDPPKDLSRYVSNALHMDGNWVPFEMPPADAPEFQMGGGGLKSTSSDYLKFIQAIMNGGELDGKRILQESTVKELMFAGQLEQGVKITPLPGKLPLTCPGEVWEGLDKDWTFGFAVSSQTTILSLICSLLRYFSKRKPTPRPFPLLPQLTKQDTPEGAKAGSLCWSGLLNTYYWLDPASQVAGVVMMQFLPANHELALGARDGVMKAAYETLGL